MTPTQPSTTSSLSSSESSGSLHNYQEKPPEDFKGQLQVGQDVQLDDECKMVNEKCEKECFIPWKSGLCTKFVEEGKEGLRCKCRWKSKKKKKRTPWWQINDE